MSIFIKALLIVGTLPLMALASDKNEDMLRSELATTEVTQPLINEMVTIKPIADHHFNLEAPNNCGNEGSMKPSARKIECQFHTSGSHEATVSVCDNAKKYCKQQNLKFQVQQKSSGVSRMEKAQLQNTAKAQKEMKSKLMPGFQALPPAEAKALTDGKKGLLVMVSTEWCPPCNLVKEFLLPTEEFQNASKDFLLIYVDGDTPLMKHWSPYVGSPAYPTMLIFNKDLQVIDMKVGYDWAREFTQWMNASKILVNDPISEVQKRVDERLAGTWLRKALDVFNSVDSEKQDEERLLKSLDDQNKFVELKKYLEQLKPKNYKTRILQAEYQNVLYGDEKLLEDSQMEKAEFLKTKGQQLLQAESGQDHWLHGYLLQQECMPTPEAADKNKNDSTTDRPVINCKAELVKAMARNNREMEEDKAIQSESEMLYAKASTLNSNADLMKLLEKNKEAEQAYQSCAKDFVKLSEFSPLKETSRAARIYSLYCLRETKSGAPEKILVSLTKDYPYDSTFHSALARHYLKKKMYKKALKSNEQALTYAYGDNWVKARIQLASIKSAMGKKQEAKNTLLESLSEIQLEESDRRTQRWVSRLRGQLAQLDSKDNKK